jgi:hypothetical protein
LVCDFRFPHRRVVCFPHRAVCLSHKLTLYGLPLLLHFEIATPILFGKYVFKKIIYNCI